MCGIVGVSSLYQQMLHNIASCIFIIAMYQTQTRKRNNN